MSTEPPVKVDRHGHTMCITLNRPSARNAINAPMSLAVGEALEEAERDGAIRVVVVTGAGQQAFCAGADLKDMAAGRSIMAPGHDDWGFAGFVRHIIGKPTIAAVNGFALGGGTELALACDLVVASENAVFGLPEVRRGIIAAAGGLVRLPQQVPLKVAMHAILTGESLTATRCLDLGLVNDVVAPGAQLDRALEMADRVAENAPLAVRASKRVARGMSGAHIATERESWELTAREMAQLSSSRDAKEGALAFIEKRNPHWTGE